MTRIQRAAWFPVGGNLLSEEVRFIRVICVPQSDSLEMNIEKYKSVIFDLDGTLYDNKGLPLKLVLADIPNMWVLGAERKARKNIKGQDHQDAAGAFS